VKLVIFGLSISSAWGNGHATLWRGLCNALVDRGHRIVFFERDVPYYAEHRDLKTLPGVEICLYSDWPGVLPLARRHLRDAEVGIVTSYCPDGLDASTLVLESAVPMRVFYDLDTPVTLDRLRKGQRVEYIGERGFRDFDLVLSYTGGPALTEIQRVLGAKRVAPLYGSVDPRVHHPAAPSNSYRAHASYLGTYSDDRQAALETLLIQPARRLPQTTFLIGGALYPSDFPWTPNIRFVRHVSPPRHAAFYCSSKLTVNVTRGAMASMGYCPSGRIFEAAACGVPILSDWWGGLDLFYEPGVEIIVAHTTDHAVEALSLSDAELKRVSQAARERTLACHTARSRAIELEALLETWEAAANDRMTDATGVSLGGQ
jgi:spore maturation protein CgeB